MLGFFLPKMPHDISQNKSETTSRWPPLCITKDRELNLRSANESIRNYQQQKRQIGMDSFMGYRSTYSGSSHFVLDSRLHVEK
jgi:hypothetical protein